MEALLLGTAATGTTAATAGLIGSAGALSGISMLSTGLTAASAFGSIMGGSQQSAVYKAQARQSELAARQEELKGRDQADKIRRTLQSTLASQNAAFAARGISPNSGTPLSIANDSKTQAGYDIETAQFGSGMAAATERAQAAQYRISASAARTTGYMNAATSIFGGRSSLIPR